MALKTIAIALICVLASLSTTRGDDALAEVIKSEVQPMILGGKSVGMVVGVVREGRAEVFGFGRPSRETAQRPDGRTVFEIGSITKAFTAIALAEMAESGTVSLDASLQSLLPEGRKAPSREGHEITLRMLANHSSGLPRLIPKVILRAASGQDPYATIGADDLYDYLSTHKLARDPGAAYLYSNYGAALLGTTLARRAGVSYEELIASKICRPLDMTDTTITLNASQTSRRASPYTSNGKPAKYWTFEAFAGAGALHSTADDMLRFVQANLGLIETPRNLRAALDSAMTPRTPTDSPGVSIALGWHVFEPKTKPMRPEIIWHNGGTGGFRSFVGFSREKKVGVVVLSNSDASVDGVGVAVIEALSRE